MLFTHTQKNFAITRNKKTKKITYTIKFFLSDHQFNSKKIYLPKKIFHYIFKFKKQIFIHQTKQKNHKEIILYDLSTILKNNFTFQNSISLLNLTFFLSLL